MFSNYFKIAWRNITRTFGYSMLNIFGLGIGMAVALLIGLWVHHQFSYDMSLPDANRLYRVQRNFNANGDTLTFRSTSLKLAEELRRSVPEIEYVAESDWMSSHGLMVGDKKLFQRGGIVGMDFLKMFRFPLLKGNANSVFNDAYSIVLTESTSKALFGDEEAIGKEVRFDNNNNLRVTGIMQDLPANSSFGFQYLVPFSYLDQTQPNIKARRTETYGGNSYQIFVKLKPGKSYDAVLPKIWKIEHTETNNLNAMNSFVTLQPLKRWHLYTNYINGKDTEGFMEYVKMFTVIGILVLIIACINFVNLTTARSERRAREVGVRKVIGSRRIDLIMQFLFESFIQTILAFAVAIIITWILLVPFNQLAETAIEMPLTNLNFWLIVASGVILTAVVSGSRPAFVLSSFKPIKVLKGSKGSGGSGDALPRKIMFVFQFTASIALIISTFIIYQQIQHARNRPTGYNLDMVANTQLSDDLAKNFTALKEEMLRTGLVTSVTTGSSPATDVQWHNDVDRFPGKNANETVEMGIIIVSTDYFRTLDMKMKDGRDFSSGGDSTSLILNEAAVKRLRLKNPVNQLIGWNGVEYRVAGVVKDALMISPFAAADPTLFVIAPNPQSNILYRLAPGRDHQQALTELTKIFNKFNPAYPYEYSFEDQNYADKFKVEALIGKLAGIFAFLAIFISCLGLFGLSAFVAASRTKEIGIRKVLGATVSQVWMLLSREFIGLVILSCVIAIPVAYYFLQGWLQKYDYRITIGPWIFIAASLLSIAIAILTMSFEAIRAALANPVKSIKAE